MNQHSSENNTAEEEQHVQINFCLHLPAILCFYFFIEKFPLPPEIQSEPWKFAPLETEDLVYWLQ